MSAPSVADIMRGLEARLRTIPGLRVPEDGQPDAINPPTAIVGIPAVDNYHATMRRGRMLVSPTVLVLVSAAVSRVGQIELTEYAAPAGPKSVVAAVEADRTLGGAAEAAVVRSFRPLGLEEVGEIGYFGGLFTVTVVALGS